MTVLIVVASAMVFTTLLADSSPERDPANHFNIIDSTLLGLFSFTASGIDVATLDQIRDNKGGPRSCPACTRPCRRAVLGGSGAGLTSDEAAPCCLTGAVVSRITLLLMAAYAVLVLIVLVNLLIALVSCTYRTVKAGEQAHMLRNHAVIIAELEALMDEAERRDLNEGRLGRFLHVLEPQQAADWLLRRQQEPASCGDRQQGAAQQSALVQAQGQPLQQLQVPEAAMQRLGKQLQEGLEKQLQQQVQEQLGKQLQRVQAELGKQLQQQVQQQVGEQAQQRLLQEPLQEQPGAPPQGQLQGQLVHQLGAVLQQQLQESLQQQLDHMQHEMQRLMDAHTTQVHSMLRALTAQQAQRPPPAAPWR